MNQKICGICGNKIGILENYIKLKDGYMCSSCAKGLGLITATGVPTEKWSKESLIDDFKETNTADNNVISNKKDPDDSQNNKQVNNTSKSTNIKCSFCKKDLDIDDIAIAFKDGRMCNECAKKYHLLQSDGYPSAKILNYCNNHTVQQFKDWLESSKELGIISNDSSDDSQNINVKKPIGISCAICSKNTDNYLKFKDGSAICIDCGKKYGLTDNNDQFSKVAKEYASKHTFSQLKRILENYGEFSPKEANLEDNPSISSTSPTPSREQHHSNDKKHSFFYYVGLVVVAIFCINFVTGFIKGVSGSSSDDETVSVSHKKHKKPTKEQIEIKKARLKNEKLHVKQLKNALADLPDKTDGDISDAKLDPESGVIEIMLSDTAVSGTPDQIKQNTHNAWIIGNQLYKRYAPYTSSYSNQLVDVYDSNMNLLGETSGWTGEYKFKGNVG